MRWNEYTFMRLLALLPDTERYRADAYGVYGCLPRNMRRMGKGGAADRNEGLRSTLSGQLNGLAQCTKGCCKMDGILMLSACVGMAEVGLVQHECTVGNAE